MQETGTRINKYMSQCGYCSRREADRLIEKGEVWINGTKISTTDSRGIGLSNMEERVRALNGVIRFDTENGFKITIIIRR